MKRTSVMLVLVVLMTGAFTFGVSAQDTPQSVCLITDIGRINDGTFNQFAYEGMVRAVEEYGLDDTFIETQSPSDYENNINTCLDSDYEVIITVGFALADATYEAAVNNPDVYFIGVDEDFSGSEPLENIVGLQFREDQAGFLAGTMAALMSESGIVAGVYGLDIPPVTKFRLGYEQGALYANPDIQTLGVYIPDFQAPDLGRESAAQFIGEGADVIFGAGGPTGSGGITYAAAEGIKVIGVDQDQYFTDFGEGEAPGSENLLTSAMKRVDNGVYDMIVATQTGEGFPANSTYVLEIANDGIAYAPPHDANVPQEVLDQMDAVMEGLRTGAIWTGVDPIIGVYLPSVVEAAQDAGTIGTLLAAIDAAGLADTLTSGGPYTIFAPTDEAFAAALDSLGMTTDELLADTDTLTNILLYHVVPGAVLARDVVEMDGAGVPTLLDGADLSISVDGGVVLNEDVNVVATDILTFTGVIHVIDGVLLPPTE